MSKAAKKTTTKAKKKTTTKAKTITQGDYILLDASGSMDGIFDEALNGINSYVKKLAEDKVDTKVTMIAFDSSRPFHVVRENVSPEDWKPVSRTDTSPNALTPLNDATMKLFGLADSQKYDRVAIVIATDGHENASQEFSILSGGTQKVKDRIKKAIDANWAITYLGANFDNVAQAATYGAGLGQTIQTSGMNFATTMTAMATKRGLYASSGEAGTMSWSAEEQTAAKSNVDATDVLTKKATKNK